MPTEDIEIDIHPENPDDIYIDYYTKTGIISSATYPIKFNDTISYSFYTWSPTGILTEKEHFVNGERDGISFEYFNCGSLARIIHYKDGNLCGLYMEWNKKGELVAKRYYVDSILTRNII